MLMASGVEEGDAADSGVVVLEGGVEEVEG